MLSITTSRPRGFPQKVKPISRPLLTKPSCAWPDKAATYALILWCRSANANRHTAIPPCNRFTRSPVPSFCRIRLDGRRTMMDYDGETLDSCGTNVALSPVCTPAHAGSGQPPEHPNRISSEVTRILDDIRRAVLRSPEEARPAALRL